MEVPATRSTKVPTGMKTLQLIALKDIKNEPTLSSSPADSWKGQMGSGPADSRKGPISDCEGESLLQKQRARKGSVHFEEEIHSAGSQHSTNHTQPSAIRLPSPPIGHSTWKVSCFSDPTAEQKNEGPESSRVALAGTNKYFSSPVSDKGRSKKKLSPVMEVDSESNPAAECSEDKAPPVARRDQSPPGANAALGDGVLQSPLYRSSFAMECQEIVKQIKGSEGGSRRSPGKRKAEELDVSAIDAEPPPYDSMPFKSLLAWEVSRMKSSLENSPEISPAGSPACDATSLFGESLLDLERTDMQLQDFSLSNFGNKNSKGQSVDDSVGKWMENGVDGEWCIKRQKLAPEFDCKSINLSTADCSPACGSRQDVASPRGRILQIMEQLGVCRQTEEVKREGANASHVLEGITSHCPTQVTEEERSKLCASITQDADVPANTTQDLPPQHFSVLNTTEVMEFSPQNISNITQEIAPVSKEDGRANTTTEIKAVPPTATNVTQHSISFLHEVTAAASTTWVVEEELSHTMVTASLNVGESIANTTQVLPGDTTQDIQPKHVGCITDTTQDIEPNPEGYITDTTQDIEPQHGCCITEAMQDMDPKHTGCITDTTQDIEPKHGGCITDTTQDIEPKHGCCITDTTHDIEPKHGCCITDTTHDIEPKHGCCITDTTQDIEPKHGGCITDTTQDIEPKHGGCITDTTQDIEPKREGCITDTFQVIDMVPVYSPSTTGKILPVHESSKSANATQVIILVPDSSESRPQDIVMVQDGGKDKEIGNTTENIAPMDTEETTNPANKMLEVGVGGTQDIGFVREGAVDQKAFYSDTAQKDISATGGVLSNTGHGVGSALQSPEQVKATKSPKDVPTFLPTHDVINEDRKLQGSPKDSGKVSGRSPSLEKEETTLHKADINVAVVEDQPPAFDGTRPNTSEATPSTPDSQDLSRSKEGNDISGCAILGSSSKDSGNISCHSLSPAKEEMILNKDEPDSQDQSRNKDGNDLIGCAVGSSPDEEPPAKKLKGRLLASESYSMIQEEENVHDVSVFSAGSLSFVTSTPVPGFSNFQFQKPCKDSEPHDPNVSLCSVTEPPQKKDLAKDGVTAPSKLKPSKDGNEGQRAKSKGIPRPPTSIHGASQVSGIPSARRSVALFNNPTGQNLAKNPTLSKISPKSVPGRGSIRPPLGRQSLPRASQVKQTMEGKVGVTAPSKIGGSSFKSPKVVTTKLRTSALPFKPPAAPSLGAPPSQICQPIGGGQKVAAKDPPPAMYTAPPAGIKSFLPKPGGSSLHPPLPASSQKSFLKPKSTLTYLLGRRSQLPALGSQKKPVPVKSEGLPVRKQLRPPSSVSASKDGVTKGAGKPNVPTTPTQPIKAEPSGESPDVAGPASDRLEVETRCDMEACRCCQRWSRGYQSLLQENEDLRRRLGSVLRGSDG